MPSKLEHAARRVNGVGNERDTDADGRMEAELETREHLLAAQTAPSWSLSNQLLC